MEYDYLKERERTIISFDKDYSKNVNEILRDIDKIIGDISYILPKGPNQFLKEKIDGFTLIIRSVDYLISSINLLRQRALFECLTILRLALETSSTAFHISMDKKAYCDYKCEKYESTASINYAKKYIPKFGEIWGGISQCAVHINPLHGLQSSIENGYLVEAANICIGEKEKNEKQDNAGILLIKLSCNIIYRFYELIFYTDKIDNGIEFKFNKESSTMKLNKKTEDIIEELMMEFNKYSI